MGDGGEFMRFVTASLRIDFLRPTPIGVELLISGRLLGVDGRKVRVALSLGAGGQPCATAEMLAVQFRD
jgi:acyl-CoA thioesterase FadM